MLPVDVSGFESLSSEIISSKRRLPVSLSRSSLAAHPALNARQTDIGWHPHMESWVQARPLESERVVLEGAWPCEAMLQDSVTAGGI